MVISSSSNAGGGEAFSVELVFSIALVRTVASAKLETKLPRTKFLRFIRILDSRIRSPRVSRGYEPFFELHNLDRALPYGRAPDTSDHRSTALLICGLGKVK